MSWSYSLEEHVPGIVTVHRPECPDVRRLADAGEPVFTLLDCASPLAIEGSLVAHSCLEKEKQ